MQSDGAILTTKVNGDKVTGGKVTGDKVTGEQTNQGTK
jgi:hypothetical protein